MFGRALVRARVLSHHLISPQRLSLVSPTTAAAASALVTGTGAASTLTNRHFHALSSPARTRRGVCLLLSISLATRGVAATGIESVTSAPTVIDSPCSAAALSTSASPPAKPQLVRTADILEPPGSGPHKATIICMHGLGDHSSSFVGLFKQLALPNTRIVLPNAPQRAVTINGGARQQAWYDILGMGARSSQSEGGDSNLADTEDRAGIEQSASLVTELLDYEAALLKDVGGARQIVAGGFSQGGAMAVHAGLRYSKELGGIISCSGYPLLTGDYKTKGKTAISDANRQTPVLAYHGDDDPVVPMKWARSGYELVKSSTGANIDFRHEAGLQHSLSEKELGALRQFWADRLGI